MGWSDGWEREKAQRTIRASMKCHPGSLRLFLAHSSRLSQQVPLRTGTTSARIRDVERIRQSPGPESTSKICTTGGRQGSQTKAPAAKSEDLRSINLQKPRGRRREPTPESYPLFPTRLYPPAPAPPLYRAAQPQGRTGRLSLRGELPAAQKSVIPPSFPNTRIVPTTEFSDPALAS